ncbi:nitric oxide synthase, salivary gland-like isoform X2 [Lingula anatina]|nr:nitric oxide synthase, salivary gland-like isoform X2 [Lingula anatina]|eukprot:XP_013404057.1 nitric oxide synthase, salivary gland-like isoform X2 [Lingula anatina]
MSNSSEVNGHAGSCPVIRPPVPVTLLNIATGVSTEDTLHQQAVQRGVDCSSEKCHGSSMFPKRSMRLGTEPRDLAEVKRQASELVDLYYASIKRTNTPAHKARRDEVMASLDNTGTYELTSQELTFGAKTAWRNAPRCIGRIQWSKLQVFDARHVRTTTGMYQSICDHIRYGTNNGVIRSAITIFPPRTDGCHDFRVWNPLLIGYACYKQPDGSVIGDPANAAITEVCMKLGWKGKGGRFDVLPLVLSANGEDPELFEIPEDLILQVKLTHPKYPWFAELGLQWFALPAVASLMFDCGGIEFTACPFNGWYMGTEIATRDLCDQSRYNIIKEVADRMCLHTGTPVTLWKDQALVEVNIAVLHSFQEAGVTIVDHHTAAETFMHHMRREVATRGGCPGDWVWIVPPMSGSLTPVFHQEMVCYKLRPSYEYQEAPWITHKWKNRQIAQVERKSKEKKEKKKIRFRDIARAIRFTSNMMTTALTRRIKCTVLFATETGKSEIFARSLSGIFNKAFDTRLVCMEDYDVVELEHETLLLIVTSTFGSGDPPDNGKTFAEALDGMVRSLPEEMFRTGENVKKITHSQSIQDIGGALPLENIRFSVFALGSRAYPDYCGFGHYLDGILYQLGGERVLKMADGDALCGQDDAFRQWSNQVLQASCQQFCIDDGLYKEVTQSSDLQGHSWQEGVFRLVTSEGLDSPDADGELCKGLSAIHGKTLAPYRITERRNLQGNNSGRRTLFLRLQSDKDHVITHVPGDHLSVSPANSESTVNEILARLDDCPDPDRTVAVEEFKPCSEPWGPIGKWVRYKRLPPCSVRTAITWYLDVTTPPVPKLLANLSCFATDASEKAKLEELAKDENAYDDWKHETAPTIPYILQKFPSIRLPASFLLTQLPLLMPRFYSISSSPELHKGEVHLTVAVVEYRTKGGAVRKGVCSSWFDTMAIGCVVPAYVRPAPRFHLPADRSLPVIMVGPGTGIAPFRGFWQQRYVERQRDNSNNFGDMHLYFGCRQKSHDKLYHEEISRMRLGGALSKAFVALSREPGIPKMYVQDLLRENKAEVYRDIVEKGGHFYVCGDISMAADVNRTIKTILIESGMTEDDAVSYLKQMSRNGRYHEDIFGVTLRTSEVTAIKRQISLQILRTPSDASSTSSLMDIPEV